MSTRFRQRTRGVVLVIVSMLVFGCSAQKPMGQEQGGLARIDTPIQDVKGIPEWVYKKGAAFSGDRRVFYGVGSAAGLVNPSLRRQAAEAAASLDLAKTLKTYVAGLQKQYLAETTAGSIEHHSVEGHVSFVMKQVTDSTLIGAKVVEYWEHPLRNEAFALVQLDLEQFLDVMKSYNAAAGQLKGLDEKIQEFVRQNAERAHDELNQELLKGNSR